MNPSELFEKALEAQKNAYAPYSRFRVGAALLCADGTVYTGCNVENASYPASNCAERTAIFKAISEGKRDFQGIAIAGNQEGEEADRRECMPCGICRQVLAEFVDDKFPVYTGESPEKVKTYTLGELLPHSFGEKNLFSF